MLFLLLFPLMPFLLLLLWTLSPLLLLWTLFLLLLLWTLFLPLLLWMLFLPLLLWMLFPVPLLWMLFPVPLLWIPTFLPIEFSVVFLCFFPSPYTTNNHHKTLTKNIHIILLYNTKNNSQFSWISNVMLALCNHLRNRILNHTYTTKEQYTFNLASWTSSFCKALIWSSSRWSSTLLYWSPSFPNFNFVSVNSGL